MAQPKWTQIRVSEEVKELASLVAGARGMKLYEVMREAVNLYYQAVMMFEDGVRATDGLPDVPDVKTKSEEKRLLHDNGYVNISRAGEDIIGRKPWTLRDWEDKGALVYADGTPIPIYRSKFGHCDRWYSPQNLWDIVHAARRAKKFRKAEAEAALLRVQQLFVEQQARQNLAAMRRR